MNTDVVSLGRADLENVTDVLAESFRNYPVMRFVIQTREDQSRRYDEQLRKLVRFFAEARLYRNETILGVWGGDRLRAVALVSRPGEPDVSSEWQSALAAIRTELWQELGADAFARYTAFGDACAPVDPEVPHLHLNMIGVREADQGRGLGRTLIEAVHAMSDRDSDSDGVSLTTENPANISLYEHLGYQVIGHAIVAPELSTWGFFRADRHDELE